MVSLLFVIVCAFPRADSFGEQVESVSKNDKVLVYPWIGEGMCPACRIGQENLCDKPRSLGIYND